MVATKTPKFLKRMIHSGIAVLVLTLSAYSLERPTALSGIHATFNGNNRISIVVTKPTTNNYSNFTDLQYNAVLVTDLSTSFDVARMTGTVATESKGADNPVIKADVDTSNRSFTVLLSNTTRSRYFVAVAVSGIPTGTGSTNPERVYSAWKVFADGSGMPLPVSTISTTSPMNENLFCKAIQVGSNPKMTVVYSRFSTSTSTSTSFILNHNSDTVLNIQDVNTFSLSNDTIQVAGNIKMAMEQASTGKNTLILKHFEGNKTFYNVFKLLVDKDTMGVTIKNADKQVTRMLQNRLYT